MTFAGDFGTGFVKMSFTDAGLYNSLRDGAKNLNGEVDAILQRYAPEIENWMKNNARWTDQTGAARNGLGARFYSDRSNKGIVLFHQVPYGIWLEVRFSGRYAIVVPALEHWGPIVLGGTTGLLERLGR